MKQSKNNRYMPMLMAACVMAGILIGTFFTSRFSGNRLNIVNNGSNRLSNLLHIIDDQYVDKVDIDSLVEKAMPLILAELDPHSVYISAREVQMATDDLKGSFFGVGIEFVIRGDTLHVQRVIPNGPAEKAGVIAGDKIVSIDGKPFVGKAATNDEAMRRLKGQSKTFVTALKLAQLLFLKEKTGTPPMILLDDIFDKLDAGRVEQIIKLVGTEDFGQIFITDTNRSHIDKILEGSGADYCLFCVEGGNICKLQGGNGGGEMETQQQQA